MRHCLCYFARERLLLGLLLAFPILWIWVRLPPTALPALIDTHTMVVLTGLLILSRFLEQSGFLRRLARLLVRCLTTERNLAAGLVVLGAAMAAVVTNDAALFVLIPLTVALGAICRLPLIRLAVFQALAVNAGSAVSPVGNPQNIYLWQLSGVGFFEFIWMMLPLGFVFTVVMTLAIFIGFRKNQLPPLEMRTLPEPLNQTLLCSALIGYPLFIFLVDRGFMFSGLLIIGLFLLLFDRNGRISRGVDWALLAVFLLMFLNLGLVAAHPQVAGWIERISGDAHTTYWSAFFLSQGISNVPATLLMGPTAEHFQALAWGVNVGGFGFILGSLANLIAMRLLRQRGFFAEFHLWAIPVALLCAVLGWAVLNRVGG